MFRKGVAVEKQVDGVQGHIFTEFFPFHYKFKENLEAKG